MCRDAVQESSRADCRISAPLPYHFGHEVQGSSSPLSRGRLLDGVLATLAALAGFFILIIAAFLFKQQVQASFMYFIALVDGMGVLGGVLYALVYFALEMLAFPAFPLAMASGAIFGIIPGYVIVASSSVLAAVASFMIARYTARDWVRLPTPIFALQP